MIVDAGKAGHPGDVPGKTLGDIGASHFQAHRSRIGVSHRFHRHMRQHLMALALRFLRQERRGFGKRQEGERNGLGQSDRPVGAGQILAQIVDADGDHRPLRKRLGRNGDIRTGCRRRRHPVRTRVALGWKQHLWRIGGGRRAKTEQRHARAFTRFLSRSRALCRGRQNKSGEFAQSGVGGLGPACHGREEQQCQRAIAQVTAHNNLHPANQGNPAHARCARGLMNLSIGSPIRNTEFLPPRATRWRGKMSSEGLPALADRLGKKNSASNLQRAEARRQIARGDRARPCRSAQS